MVATVAMEPKVVSRVYSRRDGARAVLSYRETVSGIHRVALSGQEDAATWNCATIEGARIRWRLLSQRLQEHGFAPPKVS